MSPNIRQDYEPVLYMVIYICTGRVIFNMHWLVENTWRQRPSHLSTIRSNLVKFRIKMLLH